DAPLLKEQLEVGLPPALVEGYTCGALDTRGAHALGGVLDDPSAPSEGILRPGEDEVVGRAGVALVLRYLWRRRHDAGIREREEVAAGAPRLRLARPERPGQQEPVPCTGDGNVGEPSLLTLLVLADRGLEHLDRLDELLAGRRCAPVQGRKFGGIATELPRKPAKAEPRPRALERGGRQFALDHAGHDDDVAFESLRAVDRHELHDARLWFLGTGSKVVAPFGLAQPREEAAEARCIVDGEIVGQRVVEGVERRPAEHP